MINTLYSLTFEERTVLVVVVKLDVVVVKLDVVVVKLDVVVVKPNVFVAFVVAAVVIKDCSPNNARTVEKK